MRESTKKPSPGTKSDSNERDFSLREKSSNSDRKKYPASNEKLQAKPSGTLRLKGAEASHIRVAEDRITSYVGPSAIDIFVAKTLVSALGLLSAGIPPARGLTITKALKMVTGYTKKSYKRTQIKEAREELREVIEKALAKIDIVRK
jgi:hypothetical protein